MCNKRNIIIILCTLYSVLCTPFVSAQQSLVSVGVRGGGQMWLLKAADVSAPLRPSIGGNGLLDVRYAYYGQVSTTFDIGFSAGAGIGYGALGIQGTDSSAFVNADYLGNQIEYTTKASFKQMESFVRMDVSLMLAMRAEGFVVNVGPRLMMPFATRKTLTIPEATIAAYYPLYNVSVVNELITGKLPTPCQAQMTNDKSQITNDKSQMSLLLGLELGYEWTLGRNHILGIQGYADIGLWSPGVTANENLQHLLSVSSIEQDANTGEGVPAQVSVNGIDGLVASRRMIDFGLRVYYTFPIGKSRLSADGHTRDTRKHHNRYLDYSK